MLTLGQLLVDVMGDRGSGRPVHGSADGGRDVKKTKKIMGESYDKQYWLEMKELLGERWAFKGHV